MYRRRNYLTFLPIIKNQANKFFNLVDFDCLLSYEDLVAEGNVRFCTLCELYPDIPDDEFARNLKMDLHCEFLNKYRRAAGYVKDGRYTYKQKSVAYLETSEEDDEGNSQAATAVSADPWPMLESYLALTEEAKEIADIIIGAPAELLELTGGQVTRFTIQTYLNKYRGWTWAKIETFWKGLKLSEEQSGRAAGAKA